MSLRVTTILLSILLSTHSLANPTQWRKQALKLQQKHGCLLCHTTDGSQSLGPSFLGIYGTSVTLKNGTRLLRNPTYLRQKILDPASLELPGNRNVMPPFKGTLSNAQLNLIIRYIRSLNKPTTQPTTKPKKKKEKR